MSDANIANRLIAEAIGDYYYARRDYLQKRHLEANPNGAKTALHTSVVNLYLSLQPYSDHSAVASKWESATVTVDDSEAPIDALSWFIDDDWQQIPKKMYEGTRTEPQREELRPREAIDAGQTLTQLARHLGVEIDADESREYEQEYAHLAE